MLVYLKLESMTLTDKKTNNDTLIFDIWENSSNDRCQISKIEAKDMNQCVKMVLDYYVKPEFHASAFEDFVDDDLTYLTIPDPDIDDGDDEYEPNDLTFEIHLSGDQETRDFKMISGHNEFLTLESGEIKTPESLGKKLDRLVNLQKMLNVDST